MPCSSKCLVIFEARMCSRTLHRMQVREMGRYFLNMGVTFALHQSVGSFPVCKDLSKITVIMGASSTRSSFSSNGRLLWGLAQPEVPSAVMDGACLAQLPYLA